MFATPQNKGVDYNKQNKPDFQEAEGVSVV
jgi:hypothetical protein